MKKIIHKACASTIAILSVAVLSSVSFISVAAEEPAMLLSEPIAVVQESGEAISPRGGDVIVIKYRVFQGKVQYRRWNDTRNCWVDSEWIDM